MKRDPRIKLKLLKKAPTLLFLEAHLKAINDLRVEATATLQRVKSLLKKLCEERTEEFKRKQVREYNIRWQLRLRQLEKFRHFRLLTSSRLPSGLARFGPRSASPLLPIQPPSSPSLSPTPPTSPSPGVQRAVRSRSISPRPFAPSQSRRWLRSPVIDVKNTQRWQRPLKCHCRVNANGLLTVNAASSQLSKRELDTIVKWEREECERLKRVMTFRMSVEEEAQNQTMKPFYDLLSVLTDRTDEVSREMCSLSNTIRNPFAFGDAVFKSKAGSSLEHIQLLMAASSGSSRSCISYLPRFRTLSSPKVGLYRNHRFYEDFSSSLDPPRATPHGIRGHIDETIRPLNQRTLGSLRRQLKRLESRAVERFFGCLEHRRALLGGRGATMPKGMVRAAKWRQEMLGLEMWTSQLSTNCDFSYFELSPLVGKQKKRKEWVEAVKCEKSEEIEEKETISESDTDYCN
ncbi:unnamed protein product [Taenia asiatica]|uniref:Uncharacterized protein n=1 Tax=Taenia asiatica TaxID=60517 RepID=A0A158R6N1_TAEAS|nr:unnamed protein product [Taenia asiatica]